MPNIPGLQMEEIRDALVAGYNKASLKQMLRFRLDKDLDEIVASGPLKTEVFDLLEVAEQEGWESRLVREAYRYNPGNPELLAIYEKFGLAPEIKMQSGGRPDVDAAGAPPRTTVLGFEKIVNQRNLPIDIMKFRLGVNDAENRVCRVDINHAAMGTGFLVGPEVVLTNYHVVESILSGHHLASSVTCLFDYKKAADGSVNAGVRVALHQAAGILASSPYTDPEKAGTPDLALPTTDQLDFALLRLERAFGKEGEPPRGWFSLPQAPYAFAADQGLIIAQHPRGEPMKLAIDTRSVIGANANQTRVRYRTNTEGGSSGSPVFDMQWTLAALHHYGDPALNHPPNYNQGVVHLHAIRQKIAAANHGPLLG